MKAFWRTHKVKIKLVVVGLLAALLAETCWFAISFITVERVDEMPGIYETDPGPTRTGRGIRLRLNDGEVSLFEVEERAVPGSD